MASLKKAVAKLLRNKRVSTALLPHLLKMNTISYKLISAVAVGANNGVHPKHGLIKYKEWFRDNLESGWVVLDIGCSTGLMPKVMSDKAKFVYGMEINCAAVEEANSNNARDNIEYICADATEFNYGNIKKIDCVTLSNVLEHIEHRVEFLKKIVDGIEWSDKPYMLIRVPMVDRDWVTLYKKALGIEYRLDPTHFTEYTSRSFEEEIKEVGLKIIKQHVRYGEIYAICSDAM